MQATNDLQRFVDAQENVYQTALQEIKRGKKNSHWMWYIFPQIQGLGSSNTSRYYAIKNLAEAKQYLAHPILGPRLVEMTTALLEGPSRNAREIFGSPDDMKLQSCMTLFSQLPPVQNRFEHVLDLFFGGQKDGKTISILAAQKT